MTEPSKPSQPAPAESPRKKRRLGPPARMLIGAAFISAAYFIFHLLGWRQHVSAAYATSAGTNAALLMGAAYAVSYFATVFMGPVLVLAAGIYAVLARMFFNAGSTD